MLFWENFSKKNQLKSYHLRSIANVDSSGSGKTLSVGHKQNEQEDDKGKVARNKTELLSPLPFKNIQRRKQASVQSWFYDSPASLELCLLHYLATSAPQLFASFLLDIPIPTYKHQRASLLMAYQEIFFR